MAEFTLSPFAAGFWRLAEWQYSDEQLNRFIQQLLELGITTMDHADIYGKYQAEKLFGQALTTSLRDQMTLVTKCGVKPAWQENGFAGKTPHYDASKENIISAVDNSLANFNTDRIDCLLIHRPDFLLDADEVAEAFYQLKRAGKVLHFGVSNFSVSQFALLQSRLEMPLVTNQIEASVLTLDALANGTLDQCQQHGIQPMLWSPLAGGRVITDDSERAVKVRTVLHDVAEEHAIKHIETLAYAWLRRLPSNPSVVLGSSKIERYQEASQANDIRLTREQWYRIWQASNGRSVD